MTHYLIDLPPFPRGFHLIDDYIFSSIAWPENGYVFVFIKHTSAGLCINENADPSVREDFDRFFDHLVPADYSGWTHTLEGPDDMPAHIKAAFTGHSVQIPIIDDKPALGTWQGIYLCEFRDSAGSRQLVVTVKE